MFLKKLFNREGWLCTIIFYPPIGVALLTLWASHLNLCLTFVPAFPSSRWFGIFLVTQGNHFFLPDGKNLWWVFFILSSSSPLFFGSFLHVICLRHLRCFLRGGHIVFHYKMRKGMGIPFTSYFFALITPFSFIPPLFPLRLLTRPPYNSVEGVCTVSVSIL